jgi:hypothetical protein
VRFIFKFFNIPKFMFDKKTMLNIFNTNIVNKVGILNKVKTEKKFLYSNKKYKK